MTPGKEHRVASFTITIERNVMVEVAHGVRLATDVYRPGDGRPRPVLVHRTPYGKANVALVNDLLFGPLEAVERGFAVIVQDVRGTGSSEGTFAPLTQERDDGHDTINWATAQPWCDGNVGLYGSSYMGATALQAAVDAPPSVKAVIAYMTGSSYREGWLRSGGLFELTFNLRWALAQAAGAARREARALSHPAAELAGAFSRDPLGCLRNIRPEDAAAALADDAPFFDAWVEGADSFFASIDVAAAADRIAAPILQIAGWYDGFLGEHLLLERARAAANRHDDRFVIGPWTHDAYFGVFTASTAGGRDFGPAALGGRAGLAGMALGWLAEQLLEGQPAALPPVRYFQMGDNQWIDAAAWPPDAEPEHWYLHSAGRANSRDGDGRIDRTPPGDEPPDSVVHDPDDPSPTAGGVHMAYGITATGVADQRGVEDRRDVLVYTSPVLLAPLRVAGPVTAELHLAASTDTATVVATLVDVEPDGTAINVADGVRLAATEPGPRPVALTVDLHATAYTFATGHRVRLHVTGSSFPRLVNGSGASAHQVFHDIGHPSALVLHTVTGEVVQ
jgi:putative CocE/NonD family hydrolase